MQDETILYNPTMQCYCVLNTSAAAMWDALGTPSTEDDLATHLCQTFSGVPIERARSDARAALDEFLRMSLVQEA
jgi:hypothetical protein